MVEIAPSILSADFSNLIADVKEVERAGAHLLHIDVMDGHFVPNLTFGPVVVQSLVGKTKLPFDVHLMIENPERLMKHFLFENTVSFTVQAETCTHLHKVVQQIKSYGIRAGVALNPATPLTVLDSILEDIDMVLLMSVNPGFGGQAFIPSALKKARDLKEEILRKNLAVKIQMDGGIKLDNVRQVVDAGVDIVVAGSVIFEGGDAYGTTQKFLDITSCT